MQSFLVTYSTRLRDWPMYVAPKNKEQLDMVLPLVVARTAWDVIIVRGPSGDATKLGAWNSPGSFLRRLCCHCEYILIERYKYILV